MNVIVDAQLPVKLCEILKKLGATPIHVQELPKGDETGDAEIIQYADKYDLIVLTKDSDFYHSHMTVGKPNKLLLISTGNIKNRQLFDLFRDNILLISDSLSKNRFVELTTKGLASKGN